MTIAIIILAIAAITGWAVALNRNLELEKTRRRLDDEKSRRESAVESLITVLGSLARLLQRNSRAKTIERTVLLELDVKRRRETPPERRLPVEWYAQHGEQISNDMSELLRRLEHDLETAETQH